MTPAQIHEALKTVADDQVGVILQMASERGLDPKELTPSQYRALIQEEAE